MRGSMPEFGRRGERADGGDPALLEQVSGEMRIWSVAAVIVLLCGCLPSRLRPGERQRDRDVTQKVVVSKEKPTSLIAADGSRCLVTSGKYSKTDLGDRVWCLWNVANGQRTAYSWGNRDEPPGKRREPASGGSCGSSWP